MKLVTLPRGGRLAGVDLQKAGGEILKGATDYYTLKTQIDQAKYAAQLAKANAKNAVAQARAQGVYDAQAARVGSPSPSLLLVGGLALAALMVLKS